MPLNIRNILLVSVFLLLYSPALIANEFHVSGRVVDADTGEPLAHVGLMIDGCARGTVSDSDGKFWIRFPAASNQVTFSLLGYKPLTLNSAQLRDDIEIALQIRGLELEKVVVLGESVNMESFRFNRYQTGISTTEQALESVEGISLMRRGAFGQEPSIRGMNGGQILLLVDGMRVHGACTDRMDPATSYVDLDALGEATLRMGAVDTRDGAMVGGSINLNHVSQPLSENSRLDYGASVSYADALASTRGSAYLGSSSSHISYRLRAAYQQAGNYRTPQGTQPFSGHEKLNLYGTVRVGLTQRQQLDLLVQTDDAWDMGYAALPMDVGYARFRAGSARWSAQQPAHWIEKLSASLYHNRVDHWMDDATRTELLMSMHMDMPGWTRTSGGTIESSHRPASGWQVLTRLEAFQTRQFADMTMYPDGSAEMYLVTWPDVQTSSAGAWFSLQHQRGPYKFHGSFRQDYVNTSANDEQGIQQLRLSDPSAPDTRNDPLTGGSFGVDWQISSMIETGFSYAYAMRAPNSTEAYGYYLYVASDGFLYSGNPHIQREQSHQWEWRNSIRVNASRIDVSIFHNQFADYIYGQIAESDVTVPFANGWKQYINASRAYLQGMEISLLQPIYSRWLIVAGASLQHGRLMDEDDNLPNLSPLRGHMMLRWTGLTFSGNLRLRGSLERDNPSIINGENHSPAYAVVDVQGQWKLNDMLVFRLGIENLLDSAYQEHLDWGQAIRPGRTFRLELRFNASQPGDG